MENNKESRLESLGNWVVGSSDFIFHMNTVQFIHRVGNNIVIAFQGNTLSLGMPNEDSADECYKWLSNYKIKFHNAMAEEYAAKSRLTVAAVEIQNKLAGTVCK